MTELKIGDSVAPNPSLGQDTVEKIVAECGQPPHSVTLIHRPETHTSIEYVYGMSDRPQPQLSHPLWDKVVRAEGQMGSYCNSAEWFIPFQDSIWSVEKGQYVTLNPYQPASDQAQLQGILGDPPYRVLKVIPSTTLVSSDRITYPSNPAEYISKPRYDHILVLDGGKHEFWICARWFVHFEPAALA